MLLKLVCYCRVVRVLCVWGSEGSLKLAGGKKGKKGAVNGKKSEESDIFKLVKMIMQRNFDPVQLLLLPSG